MTELAQDRHSRANGRVVISPVLSGGSAWVYLYATVCNRNLILIILYLRFLDRRRAYTVGRRKIGTGQGESRDMSAVTKVSKRC